jgi:hypothetical protein
VYITVLARGACRVWVFKFDLLEQNWSFNVDGGRSLDGGISWCSIDRTGFNAEKASTPTNRKTASPP